MNQLNSDSINNRFVLSSSFFSYLSIAIITVLYFFSRSVSLGSHDSPEFVVHAFTNGIAHPPGYPLFIMLLKPFVWLSPLFKSPESSLSLLSVLAISFGALFLKKALSKLNYSDLSIALSMLFIFLNPFVWRSSNVVEPFALHLGIASLFLFSTISSIQNPSKLIYWFIGGLCFGLAFCNHHQLALWLPAAIIVLFVEVIKTKKIKPLYVAFLGSVAGLLPLLYFFIADFNTPLSWGDWKQFSTTFVQHVFRMEYGTFSLADVEGADKAFVGYAVWVYYQQLISWMLSVPFILGLFGVYFLYKSHFKQFLFILFAFLGSSVLFLLMVQYTEPMVVERFYPLSFLSFGVFVATGLNSIEGFFKNKSRHEYFILTSLILCVSLVYFGWQKSNRQNENLIGELLPKLVSVLPDDSILITTDDISYFGSHYIQHFQLSDHKLNIIHQPLLGLPWYQSKIRSNLNFDLKPEDITASRIIDKLLKSKEIYFYTNIPDHIANKFYSEPYGPFIKILRPESNQTFPRDIVLQTLDLYKQFQVLEMKNRKFSKWEQAFWDDLKVPFEVACPYVKPDSKATELCSRILAEW